MHGATSMVAANERAASNSKKPIFPPELLGASNEDREKDFREVLVEHDGLDAIRNKIRERLTIFSSGTIRILNGSSGVGKSAATRPIGNENPQ